MRWTVVASLWSLGLCTLLLGTTAVLAQDKGPTDWSDWQRYRGQVQHPAAAIKAADLARARQNIQRYAWAKEYLVALRKMPTASSPRSRQTTWPG